MKGNELQIKSMATPVGDELCETVIDVQLIHTIIL